MMPKGWEELDNKLVREFEFTDFREAFRFLQGVAFLAEEQAHHPEIYNVYNRVKLQLSTHDAGNVVTKKDYQLAEAINTLL